MEIKTHIRAQTGTRRRLANVHSNLYASDGGWPDADECSFAIYDDSYDISRDTYMAIMSMSMIRPWNKCILFQRAKLLVSASGLCLADAVNVV